VGANEVDRLTRRLIGQMDQAATRRNVLVLAVVLALLAGTLVWVFLKNQTHDGGSGKVSAVYARENIPASAVIEPGMVVEKVVDRNQAPDGVSTSQDSIVGKVALTGFGDGERIQMSQVQDKAAIGGLAYKIPAGMRAVTVALDPIIGVAGFLKPGNHVDVIATFNVNEGSVTKTVLQDQVLLATGSQIITNSVGNQSPADNVPNATLSVDPADAERLILAESKGKLRLTLRSQGDMVRSYSGGINSRALIGYVPPDVDKKSDRETLVAPPARVVYPPMGGMSRFMGQRPLPAMNYVLKSEPKMEIEVIKGAQVEKVPVKT
jgi:pilus assembly protein CpaB